MGHQQPLMPVATENTVPNSIMNGTAKQIISRAINMIFYWVRDIIRRIHFHIFWEERKKNPADYVAKHHPIWYHRTMIPRYVKAIKKDIENSKDWRTGTGRGCAGTTNTRGTVKPYNTLKGIRDPIPQNPDNPLKVIQYIVPKAIRSQWSIGLTIPT